MPLAFLNHLKEDYGNINDVDVEENDQLLKTPSDLSKPINVVWDRINKCTDFARRSGVPYAEATLLRIVRSLFQKAGVFGVR